jgi:hypothetical protein
MKRLGLVALVLAGLTATAALAGTPTWSAKGTVTALNRNAITVNGRNCKITTVSPPRSVLRLYFVGAHAKISCAGGILRKIDVLQALPAITTAGPPTYPKPSTTTSSSTSSSTIVTSQTIVGLSGSSSGISGTFSITAIGNGSITGGAGRISLTCTIGDGSPETGGLQVGDRLSYMHCKNGVLTDLTRATS